MAAELLIASNPSGRKRRKGQSPKQRAASLRNLKKARRARGSSRRRTNPANPPRKRRRSSSSSGRSVIRRRRNPGFSLRKLAPRGIVGTVMPALIGGGGAVANDLLYNAAMNVIPATFAPELVENLKTGPLRHVGRAASALLLTMLAGMVLSKRTAEQLGTGALTVVGYNVVREGVTRFFPDAGMGLYLEPSANAGLGWAGAGWNPAYGGEWRSRSGLAAYLKTGGGNGGLTPSPQFKTAAPYTARAAVYADELEA